MVNPVSIGLLDSNVAVYLRTFRRFQVHVIAWPYRFAGTAPAATLTSAGPRAGRLLRSFLRQQQAMMRRMRSSRSSPPPPAAAMIMIVVVSSVPDAASSLTLIVVVGSLTETPHRVGRIITDNNCCSATVYPLFLVM